MKLTFYKYQGTGNDFIIIDNRNDKNISLANHQVKQLCDRRFGIGADGLMLMNDKEGFDFDMQYYNADGNTSTMCGNGGRCMVKFAYNMGLSKTEYLFNAIDGPHKAAIENNGWVDLKMKDVNAVEISMFSDYILDTGSPHYVKPVNNVMDIDVVKLGREIRYNKRFADEGINVNFVEQEDEGKVYVRTYERGVEDETLSCGTGVTASALSFAHNDNGFNHVNVKTPGGNLAVDFDKTGETSFENIWLCGPATFVFKGEIEI
ncbi:diaminopimelate epimerase [Parafilimonas terrae]|uniref:Diaminopimelate epimerase n=1 Tax=Parafilimonas terrae TaxID=1465490 RepID=A0A1I5YJM4_9BACT|nr:diaminopimelate epimerase [Parafilimonas terrae]SFQ44388.1 diaminopimelate epimerase [Parafilimonas terrae]